MTDLADKIISGELSEEEKQALYEELQANNELLYFNGINGSTGSYGVEPMSGSALAGVIKGEAPPDNLGELKAKTAPGAFPIKPGNDATNLKDAGWAVIFSAKDPNVPAIKEALKELLDLRQSQAGERFKVYDGPNGYRPGDSKAKFLERHKIGEGPADPEQMPYYVLVVGSPEDIPYRFQYQLDVMRGVGRIYFDTLQEYANYAHSVVQAETGKLKLPRRAAFFGVSNPDDKATQLSAKYLVNPLYEKMQKLQPFSISVGNGSQRSDVKLDWQLDAFLADKATKAQLSSLLGGDQTPALLFTASHGMEFAPTDSRQAAHQGALLCQDWPGPNVWRGEVKQDMYFAGDDLTSDAKLMGLIAFHFACFGAGTPKLDEFARQAGKTERATIAPRNFIAGLPTHLLGHGALAVVGHVERAWGYSFVSPTAGVQNGIFESTLWQLLTGVPIGWTTEGFNLRYADLATTLTTTVEELGYDPNYINPYDLAGMWTSHNDARGYVIVGDPAVRLPFAMPGTQPDAAPQVLKPVEISARPLVAVAEVSASSSPPPSAPGPSAEELKAAGGSFSAKVADEREGLTDSIKNFTSQLAESLKKAADDISSLEVVTYTSDDLKAVQAQRFAEGAGGMKLRALTRIEFDGDVKVCVPEKEGKVDEQLWNIHLSMVKAAQENRAEFLSTMAELATKLIGMLSGK